MKALRAQLLVLCASLLFVGAAAHAQEDDAGAVLLILDASGSMNAVDDNGVRLIDGAQDALVRLVSGLPEGLPVGLRVYGHRFPNTDRTNGCRDSELIVPVGPLEPSSMVDAIRSFSAKGFTPIGLSLEEAASDLPDGRGTVILVSDGEDTCAPPEPCEVASGLVDAGIDIRVHTVGFFLEEDDPARGQLQCIAEATNASYRDVDAVEPLAAELGLIIRESLPGIERINLPLDGSLDRLTAPVVPLFENEGVGLGGLIGSFEASLPPNQTMWYAVEVDAASWAFAWGDPSPFALGAGPGDVFDIVITDAGGNPLHLWDSRFGRSTVDLDAFASGAPLNAGASVHVGFDVLWSQLDPGDYEPMRYMGYDEPAYDAAVREILTRPEPPPVDPGTYFVGFTWTTTGAADPRPFSWSFSTWTIDPDSDDTVHLRYRPTPGGSAEDAATRLSPGEYVRGPIPPGPYDGFRQEGFTSEITRGSTIWYGVHLEWDEALSVRAFLNRAAGSVAQSGEEFRVEVFDPDLADVGVAIHNWKPTVDMSDPAQLDASFLLPGLAPRPLVGAATPWLVDGSTPTNEGAHLVSFTWEGAADGTDGEVEFVVNVHGDLGIPEPRPSTPIEEAAAGGPDTSIDDLVDDAEADAPPNGESSPAVFTGIGVVILLAIAFVIWRRKRC